MLRHIIIKNNFKHLPLNSIQTTSTHGIQTQYVQFRQSGLSKETIQLSYLIFNRHVTMKKTSSHFYLSICPNEITATQISIVLKIFGRPSYIWEDNNEI
jgi:hypothetical protein